MQTETPVHSTSTMDLKKMQRLPVIDPSNPSRKFSEKEEKFLREILTYEFMNIEEPGLMHKFPYGSTQNKMNITLMHGGRYRVPRFIANHINSRSTPMWAWRPNGQGGMTKQKIGVDSRFQMREVYEQVA